MAIIIRLVLLMVCSWFHRFVEPASSFPMLFLVFVESDPDTRDERRKRAAAQLLASSRAELESHTSDDISWKLLDLFHKEFVVCASDGTCPRNLYDCLLLLRAGMPRETQDIEDLNSILQWLASTARRMEHECADARGHQEAGEGAN